MTNAMRLADLRRQAADAEFQSYDFGEVGIEDSSGWEYDTATHDWSRSVFIRGDDEEAPSEKITFTVRFKTGGAEIWDAYAINDKGAILGRPATRAPASTQPAEPAVDASASRVGTSAADLAETLRSILSAIGTAAEENPGEVGAAQLDNCPAVMRARRQIMEMDRPQGGAAVQAGEQDDSPQSANSNQVAKTVLSFVVLHTADRRPQDMGLADLADECDSGDMIGGGLRLESRAIVSKETLVEELKAVGNDGAFFDHLDPDVDDLAPVVEAEGRLPTPRA